MERGAFRADHGDGRVQDKVAQRQDRERPTELLCAEAGRRRPPRAAPRRAPPVAGDGAAGRTARLGERRRQDGCQKTQRGGHGHGGAAGGGGGARLCQLPAQGQGAEDAQNGHDSVPGAGVQAVIPTTASAATGEVSRQVGRDAETRDRAIAAARRIQAGADLLRSGIRAARARRATGAAETTAEARGRVPACAATLWRGARQRREASESVRI
mmetsp:Transcript_19193/g.57410  ORF Transcript_19193/g.57410 Transcript_19193/m.57410 type:complete len:213 (-) Transcript_19193:109-747(-)